MHKHYSLLGLENGADKESIKIAFRRLAMVFHPDRDKINSERFREICHAYQTLINHVESAHFVALDGYSAPVKPNHCRSLAISNNRRFGKRGSPGDRRFECISEQEYKGKHVRLNV